MLNSCQLIFQAPGDAEVKERAIETLPIGASVCSQPREEKAPGSCKWKAGRGWNVLDFHECLSLGSSQAVMHLSEDLQCSLLGRELLGAHVLSHCTPSMGLGRTGEQWVCMAQGGAAPREVLPMVSFHPPALVFPQITNIVRSQVCRPRGQAGYLQRSVEGSTGGTLLVRAGFGA